MPDQGLIVGDDGHARCWWCGDDPLYQAYHDDEWGRPVSDDTRLFEKLCLEGFQAGLSWLTILRKRENFRRAFNGFDIQAVARFGGRDIDRLLGDAGIIRHRGKIEATINNAQCASDMIDRHGSLAGYVWGFEPPADQRPKTVNHATLMTMTTTPAAQAMSKDLKKQGWRFVGPTTVYAFMQAMGLVNDHMQGCAWRPLAEADRAKLKRPGTS